jgi:thiamine biosynthesis lipoprotein
MRALIVVGLTALLLWGCGRNDNELASYRLLAMATWVDISLPRDAVLREPDLIRGIEADLRAFERDYYAWGDGELAALNRALGDSRAFEASADLAALLVQSQEIAAITGGAFDPGIGALVELWGFHTGEPGDTASVARAPPSAAEIARLLAASGSIRDLVVDGRHVSVQGGRLARFTLDLGGIAKGAAVDRILERLREHQVSPALVNAGGDLGVAGEPADRSWRIGIQAPRSDDVLGAIALHDGEAAFTSGDYERFFDVGGHRLHHILDPRTGLPVEHTQAITVVAGNGTVADAAATALFVAGPGEWRAMAAALGIDAVLRVDASGAIEMTASMRDRFQPDAEVMSDIIAAAD